MARKDTSKRESKGSAKGVKKEVAPKEVKSEPNSSEPSKNDFNKLYSAMNHLKSKGNNQPWDAYKALKSCEQKREFLFNYMKDKKFCWINKQLKEEFSQSSSVSSSSEEQWLSMAQIAAEEKLNPKDPEQNKLLEALLATLPSQAHSCKAWAEMGLLEYKYTKRIQKAQHEEEQKLQQERSMKVDDKTFQQLEGTVFRLTEPQEQPLSIMDKAQDQEEQNRDNQPNLYKEMLIKFKRVRRSMEDLAMDFLACKAQLEEKVKNEKSYLKALLDQAVQQYQAFCTGKEKCVEFLAVCSNTYTEDNFESLKRPSRALRHTWRASRRARSKRCRLCSSDGCLETCKLDSGDWGAKNIWPFKTAIEEPLHGTRKR